MNKICGIYQIQSKIKPGRLYIGSAVNINYRWSGHLSQLRKNKHHAIKLQRHYNKYGESDLQFSIISGCEKENLISNEQFYIDAYKPYFNTALIAGSFQGQKHTDITKKKISEKKKGSDYWTGRKHSKESKEKMRLSKLGTHRQLSDKTIEKLRNIHLGNQYAKGNKNRLGIGFSDESKKKISDGLHIYFRNKKHEQMLESILINLNFDMI